MSYRNQWFYEFSRTPSGVCLNLLFLLIGFYRIYKKYSEEKKWKKRLNENSKSKKVKK